MAAVIMDGKKLSEELLVLQAERTKRLADNGIRPCLAVIRVGDDPASEVYVRNKEKACERLGILSRTSHFSADITQDELTAFIDTLNDDGQVDGILVQLPLPSHLHENEILNRVLPLKDADGFHPVNIGRLMLGEDTVLPCTPKGIMYMLEAYGVPLAGKHAVVVGRSNIVGKPMALLLLSKNCTVTVCHSKTRALAEHTRQADILVSAVGKPGFITADMVKEGAAVIDVGINRTPEGLRGDVCFDEVREKASFITPVPGGVGKMTVAMLMDNVILAAERRASIC